MFCSSYRKTWWFLSWVKGGVRHWRTRQGWAWRTWQMWHSGTTAVTSQSSSSRKNLWYDIFNLTTKFKNAACSCISIRLNQLHLAHSIQLHRDLFHPLSIFTVCPSGRLVNRLWIGHSKAIHPFLRGETWHSSILMPVTPPTSKPD